MSETLPTVRPVDAPTGTARPLHRRHIIVWSVLVGAVLSVIWSAKFVDSVIGDNVANTLLGYDAKEAAITSLVAGLAFAFVSGLACTMTACNVAALAMVGPLVDGAGGRKGVRAVFRPLSWMAVGAVGISAAYGFFGVLARGWLPQLNESVISDAGGTVRLVQASVVFGLIGLAFLYLGLATLGVLPDPFAGRDPRARLVVLGVLLGGLLIGRPFPLFFKMFTYAAETGNPLYGALVFTLQALGNLLVVALLFAIMVTVARGAIPRWLAAHPGRVAAITAAGLIIAGTFMVLYWDVRLPAIRFGIGWFPEMPYNV